MHGAVHRLEVVVLPRLADRAVRVQLGVELHGRVHALGVPGEVPGGLEQLPLGDVRGVDELVARLLVAAPAVVLQLLADHPALGVEDREARADLVREGEQVQLRAEAAVVAPLGLGDLVQVRLQRLLALPRRAVDALQLLVLLVPPPVRGGGAHEPEGRDVAGGGTCGPRHRSLHTTSPVCACRLSYAVSSPEASTSITSSSVSAAVPPLRSISSSLYGSSASSLRASSSESYAAPGEPLAGLDDLLHRRLELGQVVRREGLRDVEVVVEAVPDRRPDAELGLGVQLLHGLREDVCGGVPDHAAPGVGVGGDRLDVRVGVGRPGEVAQGAGGVADHDDGLGTGRGQARLPDGGARGCPGRHPDGGGRGTGGGGGHGDLRGSTSRRTLPMLGPCPDRTGATRGRRAGQGRGRARRWGAGSAAGGDGGRGGPLDAAADPAAVEPATGLRAAGRSATGGPAACCPGSRSTGSGSGLRSTGPGSEPRGAGVPTGSEPRGAGVPTGSRPRRPGMPTGSEPQRSRHTRLFRATRDPAYPSARHRAPPASLPGPDRAAGRRPTAGSPSPSGPDLTRSGWAGTSGPGGVERPPAAERAPGHRRAGRQRVDRHRLQPLAHAVQHALRPVHDDRQHEPVAERVRHRAQEVPGPAVRAEDDLAGAGRSPARGPGMQQRQGGADDLGVLRADQFQVRGPGGPSVAAADQASSTMPLSTSTRAAATIRTSRSSGPSTTAMPSARMFTTWRWRPTNRPAARSRNPRSISGDRRSTGRTPGCHRDRSGPPSGCP